MINLNRFDNYEFMVNYIVELAVYSMNKPYYTIKEKLVSDRFALVQNDNNKLLKHGTLVDGSWTTILYYKKGLCLMLRYDMRQSKDVSKGKGGKKKKYTTLWNFITCPWSCRNALFQGFVNFFTPPNHSPSQQTRALLFACAVLHFCRLIHAYGGLMKTLSSLIVFVYKETVIIIEAICSMDGNGYPIGRVLECLFYL